jgi:hypothetical protein
MVPEPSVVTRTWTGPQRVCATSPVTVLPADRWVSLPEPPLPPSPGSDPEPPDVAAVLVVERSR